MTPRISKEHFDNSLFEVSRPSTDDRGVASPAPDGNQSLPVTDLDPKSVDAKAADEVKGGLGGTGAVVSGASSVSSTVSGAVGLTGTAYTGNTR